MFIQFSKYYISKITKSWWTAILLIPTIIQKILSSILFVFPEYANNFEIILDLLTSKKKWILVGILLFLHIKIIYELWTRKVNEPISAGLSSSYENIVNNVNRFIPSKSTDFYKFFSDGYKCLNKEQGHDIKTAISTHLSAYRIIRDFLIAYFNKSASVQITVDMSDIRAKFESNFSLLENYNNAIGRNENALPDEYDIRKLLDDINDNLGSIFALFKL